MSRESPSVAKISRPKLARVYPRRRLFRLLDRSRGRPVIWISAPAGSGKTTLVNSWLDSRKLPCLWYQVDEGDADIASFFYYLGLAGKKAAPRIKRPLPLLTPEYRLGIPAFTRRYFENLCSRLNPPCVLVFDNYQTAPQNSQFHDIMNAGLSSLPEGIIAAVVSRADPPPALTSFIANSTMSMIGWEDMRLTPEESQGIARMESGRSLPAEVIHRMHERARGWAAGLILLSQGAKAEGAGTESAAFDPVKVFDYFASELFDRAGETVQDFLLKTSFLPKVTVSMAEQITGNHHAGRILADLNRGNYFTERKQGREIVYQYHPIFREFLQNRAERTISKIEAAGIRRIAAGLLEGAGEVEAAAELHILSGNFKGLAGVALAHASSLVAQGRELTLNEWLSTLPADALESDPWLLYWMGVCRLFHDPADAIDRFETAFRRFRIQKNTAGVFLSWTGVAESIWLSFDDMSRLGRWIDKLSLIRRQFRFPDREVEARVASVMLKILHAKRLDHPEFDTWKARALSAVDANIRIDALVNIVHHYVFCGDVPKAGEALRSLNALLKRTASSFLQRITGKLLEIVSSVLSGTCEYGIKAAEEALETAAAGGVHVLDFPLIGNGLLAAFHSGSISARQSLLARMPAHPEALRTWDKSFYFFLMAMERMDGGDYSKALEHSEQSLRYGDHLQFPASRIWCRYMMALALYELGRHAHAEKILGQAFRISLDVGSDLTRFEYYLIKSYFSLGRGKEAACRKYLREALRTGREKGLISTFMPVRRSIVSRLCTEALEAGIETEYVREIIRKRNLAPDEPPLHVEHWPWQMRISTLGGFTLEMDEKPVRYSGRIQKKPLEMLKALIAFGGRDVDAEQIAEALWPDSEGDKARYAFEITLHRLRSVIANDKVIELKDGRLSLDHRYCRVDAWAFEKLLRNAETGGRGDRGREALLENAVSLYKGHFLPADAREPWTVSMRERLRSRYLRLVARLVEQRVESKQHQKAIDLLQKGLEIDDIAEEFYQQLMLCFKSLGQEAEAVKVYNRCRAALSGALGVEPSSRTNDILSSLRLKK